MGIDMSGCQTQESLPCMWWSSSPYGFPLSSDLGFRACSLTSVVAADAPWVRYALNNLFDSCSRMTFLYSLLNEVVRGRTRHALSRRRNLKHMREGGAKRGKKHMIQSHEPGTNTSDSRNSHLSSARFYRHENNHYFMETA